LQRDQVGLPGSRRNGSSCGRGARAIDRRVGGLLEEVAAGNMHVINAL
jgi:hypothetical protein